jgi:hypothetical protein
VPARSQPRETPSGGVGRWRWAKQRPVEGEGGNGGDQRGNPHLAVAMAAVDRVGDPRRLGHPPPGKHRLTFTLPSPLHCAFLPLDAPPPTGHLVRLASGGSWGRWEGEGPAQPHSAQPGPFKYHSPGRDSSVRPAR